MQTKMKYLLSFFLFLYSSLLFSQNEDNIQVRADNGDLSYEECMSFIESGNYYEAIPTLLKREIECQYQKCFDGDAYYDIVSSLLVCFSKTGNFGTLRKIIEETFDVYYKKGFGLNCKFTRDLLCCCGDLELGLRNYDNAIYYFLTASRYYEEANDYGFGYVRLLKGLGLAYIAKGDLLSGKMYMDEMKDKFEYICGDFNSIKDDALYVYEAYYAYMLQAIGKIDEAERHYLNIIRKSGKTGLSYDFYVMSASNLALIYMNKGCYEKGVKILEQLRKTNDFTDIIIYQNLAQGYIYLNRNEDAVGTLSIINNCRSSIVRQMFTMFTDIERERYWDNMSFALININNYIAGKTNNPQAISMAYDNALICHNLTTNAIRYLENAVMSSADSAIIGKYAEYKRLKEKFEFKSQDFNTKDSLRRKINHMELDLLNSITDRKKWDEHINFHWQNIKRQLDPDEMAIEFTFVNSGDIEKAEDLHYGAFLLRSDWTCPAFVELGNLNDVDSIIKIHGNDAVMINELYGKSKSAELYDKVWKPIAKYLQGIKTIYYSPSAMLSNVNMNAIHGSNGIMLNDTYHMIRVSSTADIAKTKKLLKCQYKSSALFGNINFDESPDEMLAESKDYCKYTEHNIDAKLAMRSENERGTWGDIPSTKKEIDTIENILSEHDVSVMKYEGSKGNEEAFKALDKVSPDIIHIATHGFSVNMLRGSVDNKFLSSVNLYTNKSSGMMWSGLILAGGNNAWKGIKGAMDVEDGILTAEEISRLNLSNTKLVVLSACETGRGDIYIDDSVYGLSRAFNLAGAGTVVMSLWKVRDDVTALLMARFYSYLMEGKEKHTALWKAMMDVKAKYPEPYYWAGFVMQN